jgi:hypothetical protein
MAAALPAATPEPGEAAADAVADIERGPAPSLPSAPADRLPALRLLWFDPTAALPPRAVELAGQEVRNIFRGLGVDVDVQQAEPDAIYGEGPVLEVPVIVLREDPVRQRRPQRVMGLVVRDQKPTRAVWAFLEHIRWTLGAPPLTRSLPISTMEEHGVGVALGRVVAHEVIHAIAPEEPHARNGLMNHSLDKAFLLGRRADLDVRCAQAFVSRLQAMRTPTPPPLVPPVSAAAFLR